MAFKMKGSPFPKMDDKKKQAEIKKFIKDNMYKMSDAELMRALRKKGDGKTEYNWNTKTGEVESHDKQGKYNIKGKRNPNKGKPYK
tara:strand:+ start:255 stop:512 length:258 start_codon:yes stop_codon:yes gene_type:complete